MEEVSPEKRPRIIRCWGNTVATTTRKSTVALFYVADAHSLGIKAKRGSLQTSPALLPTPPSPTPPCATPAAPQASRLPACPAPASHPAARPVPATRPVSRPASANQPAARHQPLPGDLRARELQPAICLPVTYKPTLCVTPSCQSSACLPVSYRPVRGWWPPPASPPGATSLLAPHPSSTDPSPVAPLPACDHKPPPSCSQ